MSAGRHAAPRPLGLRRRVLAASWVFLAVLGVVVTTPLPAAQAAPPAPPRPYLGKVVPGHAEEVDDPDGEVLDSVDPPASVHVDAADATVDLPHGPADEDAPRTTPADPAGTAAASVAGEWQPVGDDGVAVAAAQPVAGGPASPAAVTVDVLDAAAARDYGSPGLLLRLTPEAGSPEDAPVAVKVPGDLLEGLYGADYASRVTWLQYDDDGDPAEASEMQTVADTTTSDDDVVLSPQMSSRSAVMMAAVSSGTSSSGTGSFTATSLNPSASWLVSAQSGDFAWSYPMRTPPAAAGPEPSVSLTYDSQSVDGETGSTNNQPSPVGEGWAPASGGFVERSYVPCATDNGSSGAVTTSGDKCWKTDNATISLAGHSGRLVEDSSTGVWKLQGDDGSRIERLSGAGNGAQGGEYWRLTTTDGTQYYFGLNQLPGWASGRPVTNSTWSLPVYGNDPGEPCHASTFAASACTQAWRWNLDYVVDPHANAMAYYYNPETNRYAQNGSGATSYTRGGQLDHIDYGLTASGVYATNGASDRVVFAYADRCVSSSGCDSSHPTNWPDVPWDQNCAASPCSQVQPTFWTTKMLSGVTTQYWNGSAYASVDTWTLGHSFPDPGDGTSAALWLTGITHTGNAGSTPITLPTVTFTGVALQNRVWATDGLAPLDRYRISTITSETGAVTSVNYSAQQCTAANAPTIEANANTNTQRCFPQWWSPQTVPPQPAKLDLFHKYVVTSVFDDPRTGGSQDAVMETDYLYTGTPAWRYDTSPLTPDNYRTWSTYAGYNSVEVRVGDHNTPAAQQTTTYTYFQGMDGDRASTSGGTKSVSVTASDGSTVTDSVWLAGRLRESRVLNGAGGAVVSDTINTAWVSGVTANDGTAAARMVADGSVVTAAPLAAGGQRRTETRTSYDSYGRPVQIADITSDAGSTCTAVSYATNTSGWLLDFPSERSVIGKDCSQTATYPVDAISDIRTAYDGGAPGAAPTKGDATSTAAVVGYTGTTAASATWQTTATITYDSLGRVTGTTDPRGGLNRTTTTAFTPASGGPLTKSVVTNTLGWTTTSTYLPSSGAMTSLTDANNHSTTATYDALGRRTAVWAPDHPQASNSTPNVAFAYTVANNAPLAVATTRLTSTGTVTSWSLQDGLGRARQTQAPAEGGGTVVTDEYYDSVGRVRQHNQPYYTTSVSSSGTLFQPTSTISGQELFTFDGAGRTLTDQQWINGSQAWQTAHSYPGVDRVDSTPPTGGTPTSTWTDSRGNNTRLTQYLATTPNPSAQQETTTYTYNLRGDLTAMADPAGNNWSWTFDVLGRTTSAVDPDSGTTTTTYDAAGRAVTTTDGRGITLVSTYDALDRVTALNQTSSTGPLLASWVFDSISKGKRTSATSYVGSVAGTPGTAYTQAVTGYDAADRPTGSTTTLPNRTPMAGSYTTSFTYTADGSPLRQVDPAEGGLNTETLTYSYDALGNMAGLASSIAGVGGFTYAGGVTYTYLGSLAQYGQTRSSKTFYRTFTYADGTNRLTELVGTLSDSSSATNTTADDRKYTYDNAGNVTSVKTTGANTAADNQCFTYNPLAELTQAWTPSSGNCSTAPAAAALGGPAPYWTSYTIDPATGNRTQVVDRSSSSTTANTYSYPAPGQAHPHAVTSVTHATGTTTTSDTYGSPDPAGNTTTRPGQTLTWDPRGRLASLTNANDQKQTNVYTADGDLLVQTDPVNGSTAFLGDTQLHVAAGSSTVTASRTYTVGGVASGERNTVAGVTGSTLYFLDADPIGTATTEVKATDGTTTRRYQDPYGRPRAASPAWTSPRGYLNAPASSFSNFTHLGARDYDPTLGRFISVDPILDPHNPQQNNGYAYGWNNPLIHPDPTGTEPLPPSCHGNAACIEHSYGFDSLNVHVASPTAHTRPTPLATMQSIIANSAPSHHGNQSTHHSNAATPSRPAATASSEPTNHCGWGAFLCDVLGINAAINCVQNPTWGQCLEAGVSILLDLSVVGIEAHAVEAGSVAAIEGTARLIAASSERAAVNTAARVVYEGSGFSASEVRAAESLASEGRAVTLRAADPGAGRMSDLLVDGVPYDVYTPTTGSVNRIVSNVANKGSQVRGGGIVIDLSKSPLTPEQLGNILPRVQGVTSQISDIIVLP